MDCVPGATYTRCAVPHLPDIGTGLSFHGEHCAVALHRAHRSGCDSCVLGQLHGHLHSRGQRSLDLLRRREPHRSGLCGWFLRNAGGYEPKWCMFPSAVAALARRFRRFAVRAVDMHAAGENQR